MNIKVDKAAVYKAAKELSNWGRWGADDEIGTLNFIEPQHIIAAAEATRRRYLQRGGELVAGKHPDADPGGP